MPKSTTLTFSLFIDDEEYRVLGYFTPGDPGRTSGPPENCYPPTDDEFEGESIECVSDPSKPHPLGLEELDALCLEKAAEIYYDQKDFP